jgi:hypothetical protein
MSMRAIRRIARFWTLVLVVLAGAFFLVMFFLGQSGGILPSMPSARYLLSANAQAQASILAIVLTVTLVAAQLSATTYLPRVIRLFARSPEFWSLAALYGLSVSFNLLLLLLIDETIDRRLLALAYGTFPAAFVALIPYIFSTLNLLRPQTTTKALLQGLSIRRVKKASEDPMESIVDVLRSAVISHDTLTVRTGLDELMDRLMAILAKHSTKKFFVLWHEPNRAMECAAFADHVLKHLNGLGEVIASRDESVALQLIKQLDDLSDSVSQARIPCDGAIITVLASIGAAAAKAKADKVAARATRVIGHAAARADYSAYSGRTASGKVYDRNYVPLMETAVYALRRIAEHSIRPPYVNNLHHLGLGLYRIGRAFAGNRAVLEESMQYAPFSEPIIAIAQIYEDALDKYILPSDVLVVTEEAVLREEFIRSIAELATMCYEKGFISDYASGLSDFGRLVDALWYIGTTCAASGFPDVFAEAALALGDLSDLESAVVEAMRARVNERRSVFSELPSVKTFQRLVEAIVQERTGPSKPESRAGDLRKWSEAGVSGKFLDSIARREVNDVLLKVNDRFRRPSDSSSNPQQ